MPNYKPKQCLICSIEFLPTSPKQKYCTTCAKEGRKKADRKRDKDRSRKKYNYKEYIRQCLCCGKEFKTHYSKKVYCGKKNCNAYRISINNKITHKISRPEQKIRDYFETNFKDVKIIYNDREQIAPKELDLFFPNHNLAIEVCGLYWHSDTANNVERSYHYDKMMLCFERNIRLMTLFEDEINNKFELVISRILQALGLSNNVIYARKCKIKAIHSKIANAFFKENHLQGKSGCIVAFGLFYERVLVSVCSIGKITRKHAGSVNTVELKRFCNLKNTHVVGAASKLFKCVKSYCRDNNYEIIKSYCDMRYANIFNPIYELLGFSLVTATKYTPHYFKNGIRYRNMSLKKTPEERLTGKTEVELRLEQGYHRIWDCGHRTYVYYLN